MSATFASGNAAHYADRAASADEQARQASLIALEVLDAIGRGQPEAPITTFNGTETLAGVLIDCLYQPKLAAQFVEGMSLLHNGKFEQGAKVLIAWKNAAAKSHGISTAELKDVQ